MKLHTITLELEIPDELYSTFLDKFAEIDKDGIYSNDFHDFMHDVADFRILRHIQDNMELFLDLGNHFISRIQT